MRMYARPPARPCPLAARVACTHIYPPPGGGLRSGEERQSRPQCPAQLTNWLRCRRTDHSCSPLTLKARVSPFELLLLIRTGQLHVPRSASMFACARTACEGTASRKETLVFCSMRVGLRPTSPHSTHLLFDSISIQITGIFIEKKNHKHTRPQRSLRPEHTPLRFNRTGVQQN